MNTKGILIFNQSGSDLSLISAMLEAEECTVFVTSLPLEAIHILKNNDIDVILASSHLEGMDGQEFKELAERIKPGVSIFLLPKWLGGDLNCPESEGVCAVNVREFVQFIRNHIRTENRVVAEAARFKEFFFSFTDRLLQLFRVNDNYFFNNDHRVAGLSLKIARAMELDEQLTDAIHLSSLLKDIGKIGIRQELLNNRGRLEHDAFNLIKSHPVNTVQLLKQVTFPWNVESIICHHHEHYDGNGYPDGLKGRSIPLGSRIIAIADSFVAMTTDRPYRKAHSREEAGREIMKMAGSQFDPEIVEIFFSVLRSEPADAEVRKQILVISRDEALSAYIKLNPDCEGFNYFLATSADDAIYYLSETRPHLMIVDLELVESGMPEIRGLIDESRTICGIPCIMIVPREGTHLPGSGGTVLTLTKPLELNRLAEAIRSLDGGTTEPQSTSGKEETARGVSGSLEDMGITDIIQVLTMGLKTAKIVINHEEREGEIFLRNGKVINVTCGSSEGKEAFFDMICWERGLFHIYHGQTCDLVNVTMDTMSLLLEATKALDDRNRVAGQGSVRPG
jgi:HD-GYP domain-containing protein (c-di-GMP phosphodiesterase class II)